MDTCLLKILCLVVCWFCCHMPKTYDRPCDSPLSLCPLLGVCLMAIISLLPPPKINCGVQRWINTSSFQGSVPRAVAAFSFAVPFLQLQSSVPLGCCMPAGASAHSCFRKLNWKNFLSFFLLLPPPRPAEGGSPVQIPELTTWPFGSGERQVSLNLSLSRASCSAAPKEYCRWMAFEVVLTFGSSVQVYLRYVFQYLLSAGRIHSFNSWNYIPSLVELKALESLKN